MDSNLIHIPTYRLLVLFFEDNYVKPMAFQSCIEKLVHLAKGSNLIMKTLSEFCTLNLADKV